MSLASMTGFARISGASGTYRWAWEIKSVNAKGLDLRLRLPPGFDPIEAEARARLGKGLARGTCYATLTVQREAAAPQVRVNTQVLTALIKALAEIKLPDTMRPATLDALLNIRGVIDISEMGEDEDETRRLHTAVLAGLDAALDALIAMRRGEGASLGEIMLRRLDHIAELTQQAETSPARRPDAIKSRLAQTIAALAGNTSFDPARLHQEALLMAGKADIREELDRLATHATAARDLLRAGGPVGRRLDFLAQELAREANTLCAKSNDASLTAIGLDLRVDIEQLREQVQNIE